MLLTPQQIAALRRILNDASTALAITTFGLDASPEDYQRLVDEGYIDEDQLLDLVRVAFTAGAEDGRAPIQQAFQFADRGKQQTFDDFLNKRMATVPLSDAEQRARDIAVTRAGQYCQGLGNRWSDQLQAVIINADLDLANRTRAIIRDRTAVAVEERRGRGRLRSDLRQATKDWGRDWERIANTEMQTAHQEGVFESVVERHGMEEMLAKVPDPGACSACRDAYLEHGKPKIRPASWWAEQGTNFGRKQKDWRPTISALHPWCRCETVRCPKGWHFTADWEMVPPGGEEEEKSVSGDLHKAHKLHYRTTFAGFPISVENRKGSYRRWKDPNSGEEGKTFMACPYGYINLPQADAVDGDKLDVFLGPNQKAPTVYVVTQLKAPKFNAVDELKVMLGFDSRSEAERAYLAHYDSPDFHGDIAEVPIETFRKNLLAGKYKGKRVAKAGGISYDRDYPDVGMGSGAWLVDGSKKVPDKRIHRIIDMTSLMDWMTNWRKEQEKLGNRRIVVKPQQFDTHLQGIRPVQSPKTPVDESLAETRKRFEEQNKERIKNFLADKEGVRVSLRELSRWHP